MIRAKNNVSGSCGIIDYVATRVAGSHFSYGLALGRVGRYADAQAQLEKSLELDSDNAETRQALGLMLDAGGDRARAVEQYREAVKLRPGFALANLSLGSALLQSGSATEALPYLKTAAESTDAPIREKAQRLSDQYSRP